MDYYTTVAVFQVTSENPEFSYIIRKNPNQGMVIRNIRKGMAFGWYSAPRTYNIYFRDAEDEVSFKKDKNEIFEYLNTSRYNSALLFTACIKEFFQSNVREAPENDTERTYATSVLIGMIKVRSVHYLDFFSQHFKDVELVYEEIASKSYKVTITSRRSIHYVMNYCNLLGIFLAIVNDEDIFISDDLLDKYINSIIVLDAPYFVRYLFKTRFITSLPVFEKYKEALQQSSNEHITLTFGFNNYARRSAIAEKLDFSRPIIDLGCGEGYFTLSYATKLHGETLVAIDTDPEVLDLLKRNIEKRMLENIVVHQGYEEALPTIRSLGKAVDIVMSEVVEHMDIETSGTLIARVLQTAPVHEFYITTPNKDFNKHYFEQSHDTRHAGHIFELTSDEFVAWIKSIIVPPYEAEFFQIGDSVDGASPTSGCVIRKVDHGK